MALRTEQELLVAWRALTNFPDSEGWRTIAIASAGLCQLKAGRRHPGNAEALLVGFANIRIPPADQLPQGRGFLVTKANLEAESAGRVWISLSRQSAGSLDLFTMMANDIIRTLVASSTTDEVRLFHFFLSRIRAWQDFMRRGADSVLSAEQEVGLVGEIEMLKAVLEAGVPPDIAVEGWQGPMDAKWDFILGSGAIEVKSTVSNSGFPAIIGSLDQLDDSQIPLLYLAASRFALDGTGKTLPEIVTNVRGRLQQSSVAAHLFESRLIHAGYLDAVSDSYTRRFAYLRTRTTRVCDPFPRLTRGSVGIEIRKARYELDLDLVDAIDVPLIVALQQLGAI